jgi:hypothetical protein
MRNQVVVLHQADNVRAGEPDRPIKDPNLMEIVRVDEEVIWSVQIGHPLLVGTVQRAVLTNDQLVLTKAPEATNQLLDVGDTVERVDDERQPGPILVGARRGSAALLVCFDTFDHLPVKGGHHAPLPGPGTLRRWVLVCGSRGAFSRTVLARLDPLWTR